MKEYGRVFARNVYFRLSTTAVEFDAEVIFLQKSLRFYYLFVRVEIFII